MTLKAWGRICQWRTGGSTRTDHVNVYNSTPRAALLQSEWVDVLGGKGCAASSARTGASAMLKGFGTLILNGPVTRTRAATKISFIFKCAFAGRHRPKDFALVPGGGGDGLNVTLVSDARRKRLVSETRSELV